MRIIGNAFVKLKADVYLCKGARNSVIMNCNNGRLYMLDKEAYDCLYGYLNGTAYTMNEDANADELIRGLLSKELIILTPNYEASELLPEASFQSAVDIVWFELRRACNLKCLHCYDNSAPSADNKEDLLSLEQWENIVEQLKPFNPKTLVFIGGEPLLFKGINELIEYSYNALPQTRLVVYSNLTMLNDDNIRCFKECNVKAVTSLYANCAETHDAITQVKGSFEKTVSAVKKLKAADIAVKANTVIMKPNQHCIQQTAEFITDLTGSKPKSDVIRCVNDDLADLIPTKVANPHIIRSVNKIPRPSLKRITRGQSGHPCWQGKINISYNGFVSPCIMWQPEKTANNSLLSNSLYGVLEDYIKPVFWGLSKDKIDICKDCEYRYVCNDCRPISSSLHDRGKICSYNPYTGKWDSDLN